MNIDKIFQKIDRLEIMLFKGFHIPLTPFVIVNYGKIINITNEHKSMIPGDRFIDCLDKIRASGKRKITESTQ